MRISLLLVLALAACPAVQKPDATGPDASVPAGKHVVVHTAAGGHHSVKVEIAADAASQSQGLMFRRELGAEEGMLFVFDEDKVHTFWMRNTLIPLDMIFIRSDGTIAGIVHEAEPMTETPRSIGEPTRYVLEVNGGWAARKGVKDGDTVSLANALP